MPVLERFSLSWGAYHYPHFFAHDSSIFCSQPIETVVITLTAKKHGSSSKCLMRKAAPRKESSVVLSAFERASTQPADWAINEFAHAKLPDQRHHRRLQIMATAFAQKPTAPIPQACPTTAKPKAPTVSWKMSGLRL